MKRRISASNTVITAVLLVWGVACSDGMEATPDMGPAPMDMGVSIDAGFRTLCAEGAEPACTSALDCSGQNPSPTNCDFCPPYTPDGLCAVSMCSNPPKIQSMGLHNLLVSVVGLQTELFSFARMAIAAETAGGSIISCEDVYAGNIDYTNPCYNIFDSRGSAAAPEQPDLPIFSFSNFPSGQKTLFIVYGFEDVEARGDPLGVSCTEVDVGAPGSDPVEVAGDTMRRIP